MHVTGNYWSDSDNDSHVGKSTWVDCCLQALKHGVEGGDMVYSLYEHRLL